MHHMLTYLKMAAAIHQMKALTCCVSAAAERSNIDPHVQATA